MYKEREDRLRRCRCGRWTNYTESACVRCTFGPMFGIVEAMTSLEESADPIPFEEPYEVKKVEGKVLIGFGRKTAAQLIKHFNRGEGHIAMRFVNGKEPCWRTIDPPRVEDVEAERELLQHIANYKRLAKV